MKIPYVFTTKRKHLKSDHDFNFNYLRIIFGQEVAGCYVTEQNPRLIN